jgi:hypothetical protein
MTVNIKCRLPGPRMPLGDAALVVNRINRMETINRANLA